MRATHACYANLSILRTRAESYILHMRTEQRTKPSTWRNALSLADSHALHVMSLESEAFERVARKLAKKESN